ncbi:MAG: diphthine synthase [ANME-2 cluster archaeon]|nr:diphthine synthase [ANME-2 cluster archaeon]
MLTFIGIGLYDEKDISVKGLEAVRRAERVYAEFYTSSLMGTTPEKLETFYGREITILDREDVEQQPEWLLRARTEDVVFLTGGDAMVSTTHVDLRMRAHEMGIETFIIHGSSIVSAVPGLTGLQNYRFGRSATIPHPYTHKGRTIISHTPYDTIVSNLGNDLHTLIFLDIDPEKGYMTIKRGCELLLEIDSQEKKLDLSLRLGVGVARAGSPAPVVRALPMDELVDFDFGGPLHILVVPADLHFMEAEALVKLAGAPGNILDPAR